MKIILNILGTAVTIYAALFLFWILMGAACMQGNPVEVCQDNELTHFMHWTLRPFFK